MEKTTRFLKLLAALFLATTSGLRLAQAIRQSVREAEAQIKDEDRAVDGLAKLQDLMDKAGKSAEGGQR